MAADEWRVGDDHYRLIETPRNNALIRRCEPMNEEAIDVGPVNGTVARVPQHALADMILGRRYANGLGDHHHCRTSCLGILNSMYGPEPKSYPQETPKSTSFPLGQSRELGELLLLARRVT